MQKRAEFDKCAELLKALADPNRLRIVQYLFTGPIRVSDLCDALGDEIVKVSHHLKVLRKHGLVQAERQGREIVYSLPAEVTGKATGHVDLGCCCLDLRSPLAARVDAAASL